MFRAVSLSQLAILIKMSLRLFVVPFEMIHATNIAAHESAFVLQH